MGYSRQIERKEMLRCALCEDAPCTRACGRLDCAAMLRGIWFDNEDGAAEKLPRVLPCGDCDGRCEKACIRHGEVPIRALMQKLHTISVEESFHNSGEISRLRTNICGVPLENPFLLSSAGHHRVSQVPAQQMHRLRPLPDFLPGLRPSGNPLWGRQKANPEPQKLRGVPSVRSGLPRAGHCPRQSPGFTQGK